MVAAPTDIPTNGARGFLFLYILAMTLGPPRKAWHSSFRAELNQMCFPLGKQILHEYIDSQRMDEPQEGFNLLGLT